MNENLYRAQLCVFLHQLYTIKLWADLLIIWMFHLHWCYTNHCCYTFKIQKQFYSAYKPTYNTQNQQYHQDNPQILLVITTCEITLPFWARDPSKLIWQLSNHSHSLHFFTLNFHMYVKQMPSRTWIYFRNLLSLIPDYRNQMSYLQKPAKCRTVKNLQTLTVK